jgi:hypothetical protein
MAHQLPALSMCWTGCFESDNGRFVKMAFARIGIRPEGVDTDFRAFSRFANFSESRLSVGAFLL